MQKPWFIRPAPAYAEHPPADAGRLPADAGRHASVIGAGLAGCCVAYSLAQRGWRVSLIEQHNMPARAASGIGAGVIMPRVLVRDNAEERFHRLGYRHTLMLLDQLQASGYAVEHELCGALLLAITQRERERQQQLLGQRRWTDEQLRYLDSDAAGQVAGIPLSDGGASGGLWFTRSGWLNPASLCRALLATNDSIELIGACRVTQLRHSGNHWQLLDQKQRLLSETAVVVIAGGQDAAGFTQTRWLPLMPVRGQTSTVAANVLSRCLRTVLCAGVYLTPAIGDRHILGATFQRDDVSVELRPSDDIVNLHLLQRFVPSLAASFIEADRIVSQHAALRSVTPDRLPALGAVPDYAAFTEDYGELWKGKAEHSYPPARHLSGLYLAAGFGARGITTAPLAGQLLAALIDGDACALSTDSLLLDALNPARFLIRRLRRGPIDTDQTIQ